MTPLDLVVAARVPRTLIDQRFGLWTLRRVKAPVDAGLGFDDYAALHRASLRSLHQEPSEFDEVVMVDHLPELLTHLPIWLAARGLVLVTGLGLGCVVRGLLAKPEVDHIDVVELDEGVLRVIGAEFEPEPRVTLHHANALTWRPAPDARWDYAWHDLHPTEEDPHLSVLHARLLTRFWDAVGVQGAWRLPRFVARRAPRQLLGAPRRRWPVGSATMAG